MKQIDALQRLESLGTPGFETRDAAALLGVSMPNASQILKRLEHAGFMLHASRGRWLASRQVNPQVLPELLAAPYPAYVSLQTALYYHGLIEQIPNTVRWEESIRYLAAQGVARFLEVGPGGVLTGLLRSINPELRGIKFGEAADVEKIQTTAAFN